jgi:DNA end-binding protein Ku
MAPRPTWKAYLKLSLVSCPIALYPAASASERVSYNQINKKTGNRIRYKKVDAEIGQEVDSADIVKGYQIDKNVYITVEDEEIEALQVESTHTIEINKFVPRKQLDERYFDSPYYIVPNDQVGQDAFAVIRDAMKGKGHDRCRKFGALQASGPSSRAIREGSARHETALSIRGATGGLF